MNAVRQSISSAILPVMRLAGRAYIAGAELEDALSVARRLDGKGYKSSIGYWDPQGASRDEVLAAYIQAVSALASFSSDCYLSVKAPSLNFDREAFARLLSACAEGNVRLHFDSLGPETAAATFHLADELLPRYQNLTFTIPGCWLRSLKDAHWAINRGVGVRVVKGQWPDASDGIVDPVRGYLQVIKTLAGRATHVAVASHNPAVVESSLRMLMEKGTSCEVELLYGLPVQHVIPVAQRMGVTVRIYVPFGYGWLPYTFSQAVRNPRIFWWILKDLVKGNDRTGLYKQ